MSIQTNLTADIISVAFDNITTAILTNMTDIGNIVKTPCPRVYALATSPTSTGTLDTESNFNAFLYILIVLGFYAFAIVILMIKYVRRENEEAELNRYFTDFIKRDFFQTAKFQNRQKMENVRRTLQAVYKPVILQKETNV